MEEEDLAGTGPGLMNEAISKGTSHCEAVEEGRKIKKKKTTKFLRRTHKLSWAYFRQAEDLLK